MIRLKTRKSITTFIVLIAGCMIIVACNTQNSEPTFSGKLIDVEGKPIAGHIVSIYPIQMGETGSAIYHPLPTIATSPGFLTARTEKDGSFVFREQINPGMNRIELISYKLLEKLHDQKSKEHDLDPDYELISVKIGAMTLYEEKYGSGIPTFSLLNERKIKDVVIVARQEMWIEGKITFNDKKPLADSPATFKITTRLQNKNGESWYTDRIHSTDAKGNFWVGLFHHNEPKLYKVSVEYQGLKAESKEFLIHGGSQYKGLVLSLNGNRDDIPEDPEPPKPVLLPGMIPPPRELSPQQWIVNPYNGHAYIKITCESYDAAKARAQAEGAYLVAINDAEEQKWVSSTFGNELYWIGMHKTESGQWLWDSKESLGYTNWGPEDRFPEEILAKSEKVGAVMTFVDGEWHAVASGDLFWDYTIYAILEKSSWKTGTTSEDR